MYLDNCIDGLLLLGVKQTCVIYYCCNAFRYFGTMYDNYNMLINAYYMLLIYISMCLCQYGSMGIREC